MPAEFYYWDTDNDTAQLIGQVQTLTIEVSSSADEGAVGSCEIELDDPDATFDIRGHRRFWIVETAASADDWAGVFYVGYTGERVISRGEGEHGHLTGAERTWKIKLFDINVLLSRRINVGNDCDRPAETDLARVAWVLQTTELDPIDQTDTTYIDSTNAVNMDAVDYTGQTVLDVLDDCAQQSGRNYFILWQDTGAVNPVHPKLWYKFGASTTFSSAIKISNVAADINFSTVYAPSQSTTLTRSPDRVFSGVYQQYDGGAVYLTEPLTVDNFSARDTTGRGENVKTRTQARARARRYLNSADTEEDTIDTAIVVTAANVNAVVAGHRIEVKFSHLPGYNSAYHWMRVKERTVREFGIGKYELSLKLVGPSLETVTGTLPSGLCSSTTADASFYALGGNDAAQLSNASAGNVVYWRPGQTRPLTVTEAVGHQGQWHFADYNAGGVGTTDYAGDCAQNRVRCLVEGDGTMTIHTAVFGGNARTLRATLYHHDYGETSTDPTAGVDVIDTTETFACGTDVVIEVSTHNSQHCTHFVDVTDIGGTCGSKWGFSGFDWDLT